jgi:hypothetical protein
MRMDYGWVHARDASVRPALAPVHYWLVFVHAGFASMQRAREPPRLVHLPPQTCHIALQTCHVLLHE